LLPFVLVRADVSVEVSELLGRAPVFTAVGLGCEGLAAFGAESEVGLLVCGVGFESPVGGRTLFTSSPGSGVSGGSSWSSGFPPGSWSRGFPGSKPPPPPPLPPPLPPPSPGRSAPAGAASVKTERSVALSAAEKRLLVVTSLFSSPWSENR
jgi:hypothetical protein